MSPLERVEQGIYRRSGKLIVPIYNPDTRKRAWSHPDVPPGGFPDTRQGLRDAKAFKKRMEQAKADRPRKTEGPTCDEAVRAWLRRDHDWQEISRDKYRRRLKPFENDFAGVSVGQVSRQLAKLWVLGGEVPDRLERLASKWDGVTREDGRLVAPGRSTDTYKAVRALWTDLVDDETVDRNVFARLPKGNGHGRRYAEMLTSEEVDRLVDAAADEHGDWGRNVFGPMIRVAAGAGLRPGELFAMRWHWVDFDRGEIVVKAQLQARTGQETLPKGWEQKVKRGVKFQPRRVVMVPMVEAALRTVRELRRAGSDLVFWPPGADQFQQRTHWYYWDPVRARFWKKLPAGRREEIDPGFDFYELRHWFGSYLASCGLSAFDIADQMGNSPEECMRTYIKVRPQEARDRVRQAVLDDQARATG